jgi:dihydropyrimidinase
MFDLIIRNGTLVSAETVSQTDLAVQDGRIAAIGNGFEARDAIDADGKYIIPGAIDPHVHLEMPAGEFQSSDDWESGTIAAACGGTTTVIDFVEPEGEQSLAEALSDRRALADGRSVIDYGLHMTIANAQPATLAQIQGIVASGCTSFKTYTIYAGFHLDDDELLAVFGAVHEQGGIVLVHAENAAIVKRLQQQLLTAGKTGPENHPLSRPAYAEAEAVQRCLALAESTQASLYIVHLSTAEGINALTAARKRGVHATGETCSQYLALTAESYLAEGFEAAKYICSPPLRSEVDRLRLWEALIDGELDIVATDHCPFFYSGQKDLRRNDFTRIPGGIPGIESRLALLHTLGVQTGKISLNRWVEICSTGAAKTFGLYPRKGSLEIGADADLVIFDPEKEVTLSQDLLHENVDYTPYEGFKLKGYPTLTMSRGEIIFARGEFVGRKGNGKFLAR